MKNTLKKALVFVLTSAVILGGCEMKEQTPDIPESTVASDIQSEAPASKEEISAVEGSSEEAGEESYEENIEGSSEEPSEEVSEEPITKPYITLDKSEYMPGEKIIVTYANTDSKDWVGFYAENDEPGTVNSIVWKYSEGSGTLTFSASSLGGTGSFTAFLCDNDGYFVLDSVKITVKDDDTADYGVLDAKVDASVTDGITHISVNVTPSDEKTLTYMFYWSKNGKRLDGYEPIFAMTHGGSDEFNAKFNDHLYMPDNADGIEVFVKEGTSTSLFVSAPDILKLKKSKLLYKFNVLTDLHIISTSPTAQSHLMLALEDIHELTPDSIAIFTCGDNTDRGQEANYKLLFDMLEKGGRDTLPEMHFALGNHDIVYNGTYEEQLALFEKYTGDKAPYYSVVIGGAKFIVLGSDTLSATGTIGTKQLEWLKSELASCDVSSPVFLFLHQPLIETVSGSLYSLDHEIQDWYGIYNTCNKVREILSGYPNAYLFTGHTHWQFSSIRPILAGDGKDANFVNCASVGYLWSDDDTAVGGSQGMFVEVYEDYILLRGREFVNGTWCASAQFVIPIYKKS